MKTTGTDFERCMQKYNQLWKNRDLSPGERWQLLGIWLEERIKGTSEDEA